MQSQSLLQAAVVLQVKVSWAGKKVVQVVEEPDNASHVELRGFHIEAFGMDLKKGN